MHGSSPAAWTAVLVCLVGFTVGAVGMVLGPSWPVFWVGVALALLSPVVGMVMARAGFGEKVSR